ncbi:MAG: hypothetical protein NXH86_09195 [Flavobacteriaceae bacterium]|nr:hypothetical protein [Flavobacteriaceae bacterium]
MLYLYPKSLKTKKAQLFHSKNATCLVYKRLTGIGCGNPKCIVCSETRKSKHQLSIAVRNYLTRQRIHEIISSEPNQLWVHLENFYNSIPRFSIVDLENYKNALKLPSSSRSAVQAALIRRFDRLNEKLLKVFSYATFQKKEKSFNAYTLANNLEQSTCTYCNRLYTNTVVSEKNEKITRPQFDHWYPKKKFSLLALSFHNLIPSCHTCNSSIKGTEVFEIGSHIHPYMDLIKKNDFKFSYKYSTKTKNGIAVKLLFPSGNNAVKRTMEAFKIEEVYNAHTEEIKDLIRLKQAYSDRYLSILANNTYKGLKISKEELYQLAFGVKYNEEEYSKRPFSKMKKDLLLELGMVK